MRIFFIVLLLILLFITAGSNITRIDFEAALRQCESHGGLESISTNTIEDGSLKTAHCQDGTTVKERAKAPR